ncbi:DUF4363 family protein [Paenibacillus endoradicis]|uniref:DUF4363 family protein n=1 Tax=Paenibacillus endoradicis TaxID=2972487 RepID=UPI0021597300|nr:DUF4363 family protein [Paenibacillus endoradicis]MCR8660131.1 DUF4363 family protein [Paenibacillus endoradicis]
MIQKAMLCIMILIIVSGCSAQNGKNEFKENITQLEQLLNNKDTVSTKVKVEELLKVYKKNEWKLQLLGDEGEYERLHESIQRIIVAIDEEDYTEAKIELSTTKTILEDIYSL